MIRYLIILLMALPSVMAIDYQAAIGQVILYLDVISLFETYPLVSTLILVGIFFYNFGIKQLKFGSKEAPVAVKVVLFVILLGAIGSLHFQGLQIQALGYIVVFLAFAYVILNVYKALIERGVYRPIALFIAGTLGGVVFFILFPIGFSQVWGYGGFLFKTLLILAIFFGLFLLLLSKIPWTSITKSFKNNILNKPFTKGFWWRAFEFTYGMGTVVAQKWNERKLARRLKGEQESLANEQKLVAEETKLYDQIKALNKEISTLHSQITDLEVRAVDYRRQIVQVSTDLDNSASPDLMKRLTDLKTQYRVLYEHIHDLEVKLETCLQKKRDLLKEDTTVENASVETDTQSYEDQVALVAVFKKKVASYTEYTHEPEFQFFIHHGGNRAESQNLIEMANDQLQVLEHKFVAMSSQYKSNIEQLEERLKLEKQLSFYVDERIRVRKMIMKLRQRFQEFTLNAQQSSQVNKSLTDLESEIENVNVLIESLQAKLDALPSSQSLNQPLKNELQTLYDDNQKLNSVCIRIDQMVEVIKREYEKATEIRNA